MKIPNAIHKFVLHKKKKKYGKYVCTSSYRNKQKTNSRKSMLQLAKKNISPLFIRKSIVHNPIINVQNQVKHQGKPRPAIGGCRVSNWQPQSLQLTTVEARNWKTKLYM
ncbi:MAG: hypothetical protein ACLUHA_14905 [Bacteroides stercoris]